MYCMFGTFNRLAYVMENQGTTEPLPHIPVYYVDLPDALNLPPVNSGAAPPPPYTPAPTAMPMPAQPANCPPGLEYLTQIDQILVHQSVNILEIFTGWEMSNVYTVKDRMGQKVFVAIEEDNILSMQACGPARPFTIHLYDNMGKEVLTLTRPLRCTSCCFPCCLQELEVQSPPGTPIGYVVQNWHPILPMFTILNEWRNPQLKIKGPFCNCQCIPDVTFEVKSLDEHSVVGHISRQWSGIIQEVLTDANNFGISFPMDLDVKIKAVMVGACFLIDFMFFEKNKKKDE
ncbi:Phospholipid scramblase 2 [Collichthys lucidus]|uniref:Phospholipid scramblase n=1 Tax=Collichthys lucidus TaxID=240159 RepID=A0A4U5V263_COLLU|nr:Phospholipid scramblase 2 [Collichthys lucidus]